MQAQASMKDILEYGFNHLEIIFTWLLFLSTAEKNVFHHHIEVILLQVSQALVFHTELLLN